MKAWYIILWDLRPKAYSLDDHAIGFFSLFLYSFIIGYYVAFLYYRGWRFLKTNRILSFYFLSWKIRTKKPLDIS